MSTSQIGWMSRKRTYIAESNMPVPTASVASRAISSGSCSQLSSGVMMAAALHVPGTIDHFAVTFKDADGSYNLTIERDLGGSLVLETGFAGSKGTHLGRLRDINLPRRSEAAYKANTPVVNLRPFPYFNGTINEFLFGFHHRTEYRSVAPSSDPLAIDTASALTN